PQRFRCPAAPGVLPAYDLACARALGEHAGMSRPGAGLQPLERWLGGAAVGCYAVGYPLALWGGTSAGWALVALGGPFLLAFGVLVAVRLHRSG
ncbi:MAG: hypothetical protein WCD35_13960, partial [Mycobacteriales bacterium]